MSFEGADRRAELKRVLHRRVRESLLEDSTADDARYDEDAVAIDTPTSTLGRHEGSIKVSPRYLSNVLKRSNSPAASVYTENQHRRLSNAYATNNNAVTLSRMLTQRASHLTGDTEVKDIKSPAGTPKKSPSKKRYLFEDDDTPKAIPPTKTRSTSPLGRSSTIIKTTSASPQVDPGLHDPSFLYRSEVLLSPDPLNSHELRFESLEDSNSGHLHTPRTRKASLPDNWGTSSERLAPKSMVSGVYDTRIRPASEYWLHGASGALGPSRNILNISEDPEKEHGHRCEPKDEELRFGGVDGTTCSPSGSVPSVYHIARTRYHSDGNKSAGSTHPYNVHVPSRLASKSLLPSISFPQLQDHKRQRSFTSGASDDFSVKSKWHASSSGHSSSRAPMAWDNPHWRASSSVYSSQPQSVMSSHRNSLRCIGTLHDRLQQVVACTPSEEIISVPASRAKSVDLEKLEAQTVDTSDHSSNESFMRQELAAAETRFAPLPRANTLPRNSRFREDLEQVSAELALTNPIRRRVSNLDGSGEWSRASQAITDKDAKSIWERALREHSQEDAALRHTRLGSDLADGIGPMDSAFPRKSLSGRKASGRPPLERADRRSSVENWQETNLQARLALYKLPSPIESRARKHTTEEPTVKNDQRSTSVHSTSSWTRYPSHTRHERSMSPAGEQDQVYARDFASTMPSTPSRGSPKMQGLDASKEKGPTSLGQTILTSIKEVYRSQSRELQRRLANEARGHRSSISEGGVLEYPELEMVGSISPPMPSPDIESKYEMAEIVRKASQPEPSPKKKNSNKDSYWKNHSSGDEAKTWSKLYEDCVTVPENSEASKVSRSSSMKAGSKELRKRSGVDSYSSELRASTLDFKRSLELNEAKAREKALELALEKGT